MKFSDYEKLSIMLLCDLIDGKNELDVDFIREAVYSDNTWAIAWQYSGIFSSDDTPPHLQLLVEILDMYEYIELSFDALSAADKEAFEAEAGKGSHLFKGFDGNHEGELIGALRILVGHMGRFEHFKGRESLNSHRPVVPGYMRMLDKFKTVETDSGRSLDKGDLVAIVNSSRPS